MRLSLVKWPLRLMCLTLLVAACGKSNGHDDSEATNELRNQLDQSKKDQAALTSEEAAAKTAAAEADKKRADAEAKAAEADKKRAAAEAAAAKAEADRKAALVAVADTVAGRRAIRAEAARDETLERHHAALEAEAGRIAFVGKSFAGIWLADGDEQLHLAKDCYLMMRVSSSPAQLVRAILCVNGTVETSVAPIISVTTEASRFSGGFQFTANLGPVVTSCGKDRVSTFPGLTALSFDAKTGAGSEVALYAYTMMGDDEVAMHSGGDVQSLGRNKDCKTILDRAAHAGNSADDAILKLAVKVCQIETQKAGCYTASGFQP